MLPRMVLILFNSGIIFFFFLLRFTSCIIRLGRGTVAPYPARDLERADGMLIRFPPGETQKSIGRNFDWFRFRIRTNSARFVERREKWKWKTEMGVRRDRF